MEQTYLIQRLKKPIGKINPFSFGSGSSGLSKESENLISKVWSWDYMGSSKYESGRVYTALSDIYEYLECNKGITSEVSIEKNPIYYLCKKDDEKEVINRIKLLYTNERKFHLKAPSHFRRHLEREEFAKDVVGWLELNNHFLFFADKETYEKSLELFQYKK